MLSDELRGIWPSTNRYRCRGHVRIHPDAVASSQIIHPMAAIPAHAKTFPPACFSDEVVSFGSWAVSSCLHILLSSGRSWSVSHLPTRRSFLGWQAWPAFEAHRWHSGEAFSSLLALTQTHVPFWVWPTVAKGFFLASSAISHTALLALSASLSSPVPVPVPLECW